MVTPPPRRVVVGGGDVGGDRRRRRRPRRAGAPLHPEQSTREEAARRRRRHDDLNLVGELVGQRLLNQERVLGDERRVARHLRVVGLAGHLDPVGVGVGELPARIDLGDGLDLARLGLPLGVLHPLHLARLGLEAALLDLLLLERQDVLHRLLARLGGDDLLGGGGLGGLLAGDLGGVGLQLRLLHLLLLELQRVVHLLGRQLLGEHPFQARAVLRRQIDVPEVERAHGDPVLAEEIAELGLDVVLNLDPLVGEDLAHRVPRQRVVEHAVDHRLDQIGADVGRKALGDLADAGPDRARSGRSLPRRPTALRPTGTAPRPPPWRSPRPVDLVAQGVAPQLVDERQHQRRPFGHHAHAAGEAVDAHADLAGRDDLNGRAKHQQQRATDQRADAEVTAAAGAAEDLDAAEHDGGDGGAGEDVALEGELFESVLERSMAGSFFDGVRRRRLTELQPPCRGRRSQIRPRRPRRRAPRSTF